MQFREYWKSNYNHLKYKLFLKLNMIQIIRGESWGKE